MIDVAMGDQDFFHFYTDLIDCRQYPFDITSGVYYGSAVALLTDQ
jgi:hypothetical protein